MDDFYCGYKNITKTAKNEIDKKTLFDKNTVTVILLVVEMAAPPSPPNKAVISLSMIWLLVKSCHAKISFLKNTIFTDLHKYVLIDHFGDAGKGNNFVESSYGL